MKPFDFRALNRNELIERVGSMDQAASMRLVEAADGLAKGSRMLEVCTGSGLSFTILPDRAMDISACSYRGIPLSWTSPVGDVHPAFYEAEGIGWLRSFQGGLLVTCGLDHFGPPGVDAGEALGQHGRISNLPARYLSYRAGWQGEHYVLEAGGEVRQARIFGENLALRRRISTRLGANTIRIEDVVSNEGFEPHPHMILYHFNLGFPLLSETAQLHVDAQQTTARDADAEPGLASWMRFQAPTAGYREQVFHHLPAAGPDGFARVELRNPTLGLGVRWSYPLRELPNLYQWKMMGQGLYVLGVEPSNSSTAGGRPVARASGKLPMLGPGESCSYTIEVEVFDC